MLKQVFLKELQRGGGSVMHVEQPLEAVFDWLDEDRVIVYLYKQKSEIFCKVFNLDNATKIHDKLVANNNPGDSKYAWITLLDGWKDPDEEDDY